MFRKSFFAVALFAVLLVACAPDAASAQYSFGCGRNTGYYYNSTPYYSGYSSNYQPSYGYPTTYSARTSYYGAPVASPASTYYPTTYFPTTYYPTTYYNPTAFYPTNYYYSSGYYGTGYVRN